MLWCASILEYTVGVLFPPRIHGEASTHTQLYSELLSSLTKEVLVLLSVGAVEIIDINDAEDSWCPPSNHSARECMLIMTYGMQSLGGYL